MTAPSLRWGILGTGNIAAKFALDCATVRERVTLRAVGSRDSAKAQAFASAHGVARAYGSYAEVLADDSVDAVYIALLNHQHGEWTVRAARAGKHVLCEKPAAMNAAEAEAMIAAVRTAGVFFMEGFIYRCHPRSTRLRRLIADGAIGELRMAHASYAFDGSALDRARLWTRATGGGAIMDVGVYPLSWLLMVAGGEPIDVAAVGALNADGIDEWAAGALRFPSRLVGGFATAVRCAQPNAAAIYGAAGWIEVPDPWRAPLRKATLILHRPDKADEAMIVDDGLGGLAREALVVADYVEQRQAPFITWDDTLAQARLLDQVRARLGVWWEGEDG